MKILIVVGMVLFIALPLLALGQPKDIVNSDESLPKVECISFITKPIVEGGILTVPLKELLEWAAENKLEVVQRDKINYLETKIGEVNLKIAFQGQKSFIKVNNQPIALNHPLILIQNRWFGSCRELTKIVGGRMDSYSNGQIVVISLASRLGLIGGRLTTNQKMPLEIHIDGDTLINNGPLIKGQIAERVARRFKKLGIVYVPKNKSTDLVVRINYEEKPAKLMSRKKGSKVAIWQAIDLYLKAEIYSEKIKEVCWKNQIDLPAQKNLPPSYCGPEFSELAKDPKRQMWETTFIHLLGQIDQVNLYPTPSHLIRSFAQEVKDNPMMVKAVEKALANQSSAEPVSLSKGGD